MSRASKSGASWAWEVVSHGGTFLGLLAYLVAVSAAGVALHRPAWMIVGASAVFVVIALFEGAYQVWNDAAASPAAAEDAAARDAELGVECLDLDIAGFLDARERAAPNEGWTPGELDRFIAHVNPRSDDPENVRVRELVSAHDAHTAETMRQYEERFAPRVLAVLRKLRDRGYINQEQFLVLQEARDLAGLRRLSERLVKLGHRLKGAGE